MICNSLPRSYLSANGFWHIVAASIFILVTIQKLILLGATFTNVTLIGWRNGDSETRPWSRVKSVTLNILSSTMISCLRVAMCHLVPNSSLRPSTPSKDFLSVQECTKRVRNWKRLGVAIETFQTTLNSSYQQKHWMMSTQLSTIFWKRKRRVCDAIGAKRKTFMNKSALILNSACKLKHHVNSEGARCFKIN